MATKSRPRKQKPVNKKLALLLATLAAAIGVFVIVRSSASTPPFTRLQCYGVDHLGYKDTEACYAKSVEGVTGRSFIAVFNRTPEPEALKYWSNVYNSLRGAAQQQLITKLLDSPEAKRKLIMLPNDTSRVTYLYNSVLKRRPDTAGAKYWEARMKVDNNLAKTITAFTASSEAYSKTHVANMAAINKLPGSWWPTRQPQTVLPRGVYSNWAWRAPSTGYVSMEHNLTVDNYKEGSNYFWSHQFGFIGGEGGYIGLQSTGVKNANGTYRKQAVFSIFSAAIAAEPSNCKIEHRTFDGAPGSGTSCIISFDWVQGRTYKLRVAKTGQDSRGSWWSGWVIDTATGRQTLIARISTPSSWKGLNNSSTMWTENFTSNATSCNTIPYSRVRFSKPLANGSITPAGSSHFLASSYQCNNSRAVPSNTGVTQEVGKQRN